MNGQQSELRLTRRPLLLFLITLPLLLALVGFALQGSQAPSWPLALEDPSPRGRIVTRDGTVLADGPAEHRRYPQGTLAAHLIGFSGREQPDGRYGLEGLEYTYDGALQAGETVVTTIDPTYQAAAQSHLRETVERYGAENGAVVMLEAGTGRVLAAASYPEFDPNHQAGAAREALINRAFLQQYEPGSVMKPFVVAALMEGGRLQAHELIDAEPCKRVGTKTFCDVTSHEPQLEVKEVLRHSSNTAMLHLAERFEPEELYAWYRHFGFGRDLAITSAFTRSGTLNPWQGWVPQDHASVSIGQSMSTTALQLATAYSIIANDGLYVTPRLVEDEEVPAPYRALSTEVARSVRAMLQHTVDESGIRQSKIPDVTMAGKTGTADVYDDVTGTYPPDDYALTFAGMFPAEAPEVVMVVMLMKPDPDSTSTYVAAPIFRAIGSEIVAHWGQQPQAPALASGH